MANNVITADARDFGELIQVLGKYRQLSGKSWDEILEHEQSEWRWELWRACKAISPKPNDIYREAAGRDFRVRRHSNSITKTDGDFSRAARAAAESKIGTDKSDLFRVEVTPNGVFVKPVRFSAKKSERLLLSKRSDRLGAIGKRAKNTSEEAIAKAREADPSIKRLNIQALSVAIELSLRSRAAKGGTMALQFLGVNFKRRKSSTVKTGPVVIRSAQGIPLGMVEFHRFGDASEATISALVPGTARQITRHGILRTVESARVKDRMIYIDKKLAKAKQQALRR